MDARSFSPACERNQEPIRAVLAGWLPPQGRVLEIAAGTGQHAAYLGAAFPALEWQPTDRTSDDFASIVAWTEGVPSVKPPLVLDVTGDDWPVEQADFIFNANMIHISPWATTEGLFRGAATVLESAGRLALYGPFRRAGVPTAPSNESFDGSLKARDPSWGLRDLEAVEEVAAVHGLRRVELVEMPANNLFVLFEAGTSHP